MTDNEYNFSDKYELEQFKPFSKDVLLQIIDPNNVQGNMIHVPQQTDKDQNQFYKVIKRGDSVQEVEIGDVVWLPWARCMIPFDLGTEEGLKKFTITNEDEIELVIEE